MDNNKAWADRERSVTLTDSEWNRLSCYILMTTNYREGERGAWLKLAEEKHPNGEPVFPDAPERAEYWKFMDEDLNRMRGIIDDRAFGETQEGLDISVTLTNTEWNRLNCYILMTTNYREGERGAWLKLAEEKHPDGRPVFPNAPEQAEYWKSMDEDLNRMCEVIDGLSLDEKLTEATAKSEEYPGSGAHARDEILKD